MTHAMAIAAAPAYQRLLMPMFSSLDRSGLIYCVPGGEYRNGALSMHNPPALCNPAAATSVAK
jgi:hypothetical protein